MKLPSVRQIYARFLKIRGTPHEIGLGFALGLFIGFSPTMGIQIALAIFATSLLKWSKIAAVIGVQITNPITAPFIYGVTYFLGARLFGLEKPLEMERFLTIDSLSAMVQQAPRIFAAMTIGGVLVGLPVAAVGYIVVYKIMTRYQEKFKARIKNSTRKVRQRVKLYKLQKKKK